MTARFFHTFAAVGPSPTSRTRAARFRYLASDLGASHQKKMYIMGLLRSLRNGPIVLAGRWAAEFGRQRTQQSHSASR